MMFSTDTLFIYLISVLVFAVPLWKLLPRAGFSPLLSLLSFVPFCGIFLLWVVAFRVWPTDGELL